MNLRKEIEEAIAQPLSGDRLTTGKITTASGESFFLKAGAESTAYRCEANGLTEIAAAGVIRTPKVIAADSRFLVTELIDNGRADRNFFRKLGRSLARLHQHTADQYGFYENNYIGANPQYNIPVGKENRDWTEFYWNKRLLFQYKLAEQNGYVTSRLRDGFCHLEKRIESLFAGSEEPPALLHGDLWAGNFLCDPQGDPVLIDPAVYYGHREADLAMTRLFGGFSPEFYTAYQEIYPLKEGWQQREGLYRLYHLLNHLNIFGRSYLADAEHIVRSYRE